jgi:hypothetical protein
MARIKSIKDTFGAHFDTMSRATYQASLLPLGGSSAAPAPAIKSAAGSVVAKVAESVAIEPQGSQVAVTFLMQLSAPAKSPAHIGFVAEGGALGDGQQESFKAAGNVRFDTGQSEQLVTVLMRPDQVDPLAGEFNINLTSYSSGVSVAAPVSTFKADPLGGMTQASVETPVMQAAGNEETTQVAPSEPLTFHAMSADAPSEPIFSAQATPTTAISASGLPLTIAIGDGVTVEPANGSVAISFLVILNTAALTEVRVGFATSNNTALAGLDYVATSGEVVFAPGQLIQTVTVIVNGDNLDENTERFNVDLFNATPGVTIIDAAGSGVIADATDDVPPTVSVNDVTVTEGDNGQTFATFTVSLSGASGKAISVRATTANDTAIGGADFVNPGSVQLSFAPGETVKTVTVPINGDLLNEGNERFFVNLSNPVNVTIADGQGIGTIIDNDPLPNLSINDVTVGEPFNGQVNVTFTVALDKPSGRNVSVGFNTADGTATAGQDYTPASGTVTFTPGQTTKTITVTVNADQIDELTESFLVNLTNPTNANIADGQGVGTINDDINDAATISIGDIAVAEPVGDSGQVPVSFTVTLSQPSSQTVSVNFTTLDGLATAGLDYQGVSGTVTFAPGQTSQIITVLVNADTLDELDEDFSVNLSNPVNAAILDGQGIATISDDPADGAIINISDAPLVSEPASGTVTVTFEVTLNAPSSQAVSVDFTTADGTAVAGQDYQPVSGTVVFAPGETSQFITVTVNADAIDELTEAFTVNLSNPVNGAIADGAGTGTIEDDVNDAATLSINDVTVTEPAGDTGQVSVTFTVTLSQPSSQNVSVDFSTADGSATAGQDYEAVTGSINFGPGETTKTVTVLVNADAIDELAENFTVNLSNPTNAAIVDGQGVGTIEDDSADAATISIGDASVTEPVNGTVTATFTVTLSQASDRAVSVDFSTVDGTAVAGQDYDPASGTITFGPGETTKTITVTVNADAIDELTEAFTVELSNPTNATIIDGQGIGTIDDAADDAATLSIGDVTISEPTGDTGQVPVSFTITLSQASSQAVSVDFGTADGSALAGLDYEAVGGSVTFAPGETSKTITVLVNADALDELDETFAVNLSNPINATIGDGQGVGTIQDDATDATSISIGDAPVVSEPANGTVDVTFTVTLDKPSSQAVSVDFTTVDGTAVAGQDYQAIAGSITFGPGETTKTITVTVNADAIDELTEAFTVELSNPTNATIADGQGVGTIQDDVNDAATIAINDVAIGEPVGDTGQVPLTFTVTLSQESSQTVSVDFTTANGSALAGLDYEAIAGTVTFTPGQTTQTITVLVNADAIDELDENFTVNLSNPTNATIADGQGVGTIQDDPTDATTIAINDVTTGEPVGDTGQVPLTFTVTLSQESDRTVSVDFTTTDGSALAGLDYEAISGTVTFGPGETSKTITVLVNADVIDELDENFTVNLSNPTNATIADGQGVGTIQDDPTDATTISIGDAPVVSEPANGTVTVSFEVTLSQPSSQPVSVDFTTVDGTALAGQDYDAINGTVTFGPGETTKTITVTVNADAIDELTEAFTVELSNPTNAAIADGQGVGTIEDDVNDAATIAIDDVTIGEPAGDTGQVPLTFTVTLSQESSQEVTVDFSTADGSALAGLDYEPISGTVTFGPGETSKTITVLVNADVVDEFDENFTVELSNPTNATIADGQGVGTITDDPLDNRVPNVDITDVDISEPVNGTVQATFIVSLSEASILPVTLDFATFDIDATAGEDYEALSGSLFFAPGETVKTISVTINADAISELDEFFGVQLSNGVGVNLSVDPFGLAVITNSVPKVSVGDITVTETGAPGDLVDAEFTIVLDRPSLTDIIVSFETADGTALAGDGDFIPTTGSIVIPAGETTATVFVPVLVDAISDAGETFSLVLTGATDAEIADDTGVATILDGGVVLPTLAIDDVQVTEPDSGTVTLKFTVTLDQASTLPVTVDFQTVDGSAQAGQDYQSVTGTITFQPGETTQQITVEVDADDVDEISETLSVVLSNASNAAIADDTGVGTIDDATGDAATIAIGDATVTEPANGTVTALFTVTLSQASSEAVTVDFNTVGSGLTPATAGLDFTPASGTLTFLPGQLTQTIAVTVNADALDEFTENFTVELTNPTNATIADGQGLGTILDNPADVAALAINDVTVSEPANGTVTATFTITLSQAADHNVSVDFNTAGVTATAGQDFVATSGTVSFAPGEVSKTVTVTVNADSISELTETFNVNLTNPNGAIIADNRGTGTILDNPVPSTLSINDAVNISEPNNGTVDVTFTVTLNQASSQAVSVAFATADGTAVAGQDYQAVSGTLNFAPGEVTKTITVKVNADAVDELQESFSVNLSSPTNATIADGQGVGTINDDPADVATLSISGSTLIAEPATGTTTITYTISLSQPSSQPVSVNVSPASGTAALGADFTAAPASITFAPGETTKTYQVTVNSDLIDEAAETFSVSLSNPTNAVIGTGSITTNISDDPADQARFSITDVTVGEPDNGTVAMTFTVSLSQPSSQVATIDFATQNGSAVAGQDFTAATGTVTFNPGGPLTQTITVLINADNVDEATENLSVVLSNPVNGAINDGLGVGTITDDPADAATLTIGTPVLVTEPATGTATATFTVTLSQPSSQTVSVGFATADGTAVAGQDYVATSGTLSFAPGEVTKTITVTVNADNIDELQEAFNVNLTNPTNATIVTGTAVGQINDDPADVATVSIGDVTVTEAQSGKVNADFTVTLSQPSSQTVTVTFNTVDGTAVDGADYNGVTGTITFAPGETSKSVSVSVNADVDIENAENFQVVLSNPVNAGIGDGIGAGTINDSLPIFTLPNDLTFREPAVGDADVFGEFLVQLSKPYHERVSVVVVTRDDEGIAGEDYVALRETIVFEPGETEKFVKVQILADGRDEPTENFDIVLESADNAIIDTSNGNDSVPINIFDSSPPKIDIGDATVSEPVNGTVNVSVQVSLSKPTTDVVTVDFASSNLSAIAGLDYTAKSGTLTFAPGDISQSIQFTINADSIDEVSEFFSVALTNAVNGEIRDGVASVQVDDGTPLPVITVDDPLVTEPNGGQADMIFTVRLDHASLDPVTVNFLTQGGTATTGADFVAQFGTITFPPGSTQQTVIVKVNADAIDEAPESFSLRLAGATNATIGDNLGVATINDDPADAPTIAVDDVTVNEPSDGSTGIDMVFTVKLSAASPTPVTVQFATASATAIAGTDFVSKSGTLTFAPGVLTQQVTIRVLNDNIQEATEQFELRLSSPTNATIADGVSVGRIQDAEIIVASVPGSGVPLQVAGAASATDGDDVMSIQPVTRSAPLQLAGSAPAAEDDGVVSVQPVVRSAPLQLAGGAPAANDGVMTIQPATRGAPLQLAGSTPAATAGDDVMSVQPVTRSAPLQLAGSAPAANDGVMTIQPVRQATPVQLATAPSAAAGTPVVRAAAAEPAAVRPVAPKLSAFQALLAEGQRLGGGEKSLPSPLKGATSLGVAMGKLFATEREVGSGISGSRGKALQSALVALRHAEDVMTIQPVGQGRPLQFAHPAPVAEDSDGMMSIQPVGHGTPLQLAHPAPVAEDSDGMMSIQPVGHGMPLQLATPAPVAEDSDGMMSIQPVGHGTPLQLATPAPVVEDSDGVMTIQPVGHGTPLQLATPAPVAEDGDGIMSIQPVGEGTPLQPADATPPAEGSDDVMTIQPVGEGTPLQLAETAPAADGNDTFRILPVGEAISLDLADILIDEGGVLLPSSDELAAASLPVAQHDAGLTLAMLAPATAPLEDTSSL